MKLPAGFRKWLAFGTGVGIEVRGSDLYVCISRIRPSGTRILGAAIIPQFRSRPATEWGKEYATFLRKHSAGHLAAVVLLPRNEVIVRQILIPGVTGRELEAAVRFQVDTLHPYEEEDAVYTAARISDTPAVVVGITRREVLDQYLNLFAEAGIRVASFSFSAAVIHSAARLISAPPASGFLALYPSVEGVEAYGESEARPLFSALFPGDGQRAAALAAAELRLPDVSVTDLTELLPAPVNVHLDNPEQRAALKSHALAYAAALAGACPRLLALPANFLPEPLRSSSSRWIYVPTVALATSLALLLVALSLEGAYNRRRYLEALQTEIHKLEPQLRRAAALEKAVERDRARAKQLDDFRKRSKDDMDVLLELTRILAPPVWVNALEITRTTVHIGGEADQAAPLIKLLDNSKLLENSEFTMPLMRTSGGEVFRIRAQREFPPKEDGSK